MCVWVPKGDHVEGGMFVAVDIDEHFHIIKATVDMKEILDDYVGVPSPMLTSTYNFSQNMKI